MIRAGLSVACLLALSLAAFARDDGRWAGSPNKDWFDSLRSELGPCCSDADGSAVADPDWEVRDTGGYRVRIKGHWFDVPPAAVLKVKNKVGHVMVWPVFKMIGGFPTDEVVNIRCFLPGSLT